MRFRGSCSPDARLRYAAVVNRRAEEVLERAVQTLGEIGLGCLGAKRRPPEALRRCRKR